MNSKQNSKKAFKKRKIQLKNRNQKFEIKYTSEFEGSSKNASRSNSKNAYHSKTKNDFNKDTTKMEIDENYNDDFNRIPQEISNLQISKDSNPKLPEVYSNKIGRFWEKQTLFCPVYIKGQIEILKSNILISNVGSKLKFLDGSSFEVIYDIFQKPSSSKASFSGEQEIFKGPRELSYNDEEIVSFYYINSKQHVICCMENSLLRVFDISDYSENNNNKQLFSQAKVKSISQNLIRTIKLNKTVVKKMASDCTQRLIGLMMTDKSIRILDTDTYSIICNFSGHYMFVNDIIFSPIKSNFVLYSGSEDGEILVWDVLLGKCLGSVTNPLGNKGLVITPAIKSLVISNDGNILISYSQDLFIRLYNISNFPGSLSNNQTKGLLIKEISVDEDFQVNCMLYFTRLSNSSIKSTPQTKEPSLPLTVPYLLLGTEKGTLTELNLKTGEVESSLKVIARPLLYLKYNPNNQCILIITDDQMLFNVKPIQDISVSSIEEAQITNAFPGFCEEIIDLKTTSNCNVLFTSNDLGLKYFDYQRKVTRIFEGHKDFILGIDYKNGFVSTSSKDGTLRVWKEYYEFAEDSKTLLNEDSKSTYGKELIVGFKSIFVLKGHNEAVNSSCLLTKNNSLLVCSVSKDKSMKLWDLTDYFKDLSSQVKTADDLTEKDRLNDYSKALKQFKTQKARVVNSTVWTEVAHDDEINFIKCSYNEKLLATGSSDKLCKVWKLHSFRHSKKTNKVSNADSNENYLELLFELKGHSRVICDLAFSRVSKIAATGSTDKTIKIWDLNDGSCLSTLTGHLAAVTRVEWVYLGTHLLSAGGDGLIKLWNLKTSENVITLSAHDGKIWGLALKKPISVLSENQDLKEKFLLNFKNNFISEYFACENNAEVEGIKQVVEGECIQLNFLTGGSDSQLNYWFDCTASKEIEMLKEKELRLMKEEHLRSVSGNKSFLEAMKLSLELNHKRDFFNNFILFIENHKKQNLEKSNEEVKKSTSLVNYRFDPDTYFKKLTQSSSNNLMNNSPFASNSPANNNIGMVINNRRLTEALELNNDNIGRDGTEFKSLDLQVLINELKQIILENTVFLMEIVRDNNIKVQTSYYSQILLRVILKVIPAVNFLGGKKGQIKASRKVANEKSKNLLKSKGESSESQKDSALDVLNKEFQKLTKGIDNQEETREDEGKDKYNKVDFIENFSIIKNYTDKHSERVNKELTNSYLLDQILESLLLVPNQELK